MTYQYLKVEMVEKANKNGGFVDQKNFKMASKYGLDSLILSASSLRILESYISDIRPLLKPRCDYVLVKRSGAQFTKLSNLMSKLIYDSIGKYVHPTRLRQIIETESSISLDRSEQEIFRKIKNTVLSLPKFTTRNDVHAILLPKLMNVWKGHKVKRGIG